MFLRTKWRDVQEPRFIDLPLRLIEHQFGSDNVDNAGDEVINLLAEMADYPGQYTAEFELKCSHPNPWFHVLNVEVTGMDGSAWMDFQHALATLELIEASD